MRHPKSPGQLRGTHPQPLVILEDSSALDASYNDVMQNSGSIDKGLSRHRVRIGSHIVIQKKLAQGTITVPIPDHNEFES